MSQYKYSAIINEHRARAVGLLMPISTKQGIEICSLIRGKNLQKAREILNEVIDMKRPIPFKRFTEGAGHKHGIGPGKYPVKACREILKLVNLVEANAQHKGLDTSSLWIIHICAKKGPKSWHYGRQSRIAMKRTHVEIVVEEKEIKKEKKKDVVKEKQSEVIKKQEEKKVKEVKEKPKEEKSIAQKTEKVEKKPEVKKQDIKTEQSQEIKKPAEEKPAEAKAENNIEEKKDDVKKEQPKENVPTAAELAEKAKSKKVPATNELTKKKESKVDKK